MGKLCCAGRARPVVASAHKRRTAPASDWLRPFGCSHPLGTIGTPLSSAHVRKADVSLFTSAGQSSSRAKQPFRQDLVVARRPKSSPHDAASPNRAHVVSLCEGVEPTSAAQLTSAPSACFAPTRGRADSPRVRVRRSAGPLGEGSRRARVGLLGPSS